MIRLIILTLWTVIPGIRPAGDHESPIYGPIVYLMDWHYNDVAKECEYLGQYGYGAVVVSPPFEHVVNTPNRPWHERYEVISYNRISRSGDAVDLINMMAKCSTRNIGVIVDVVLNHMASTERGYLTGSGGSNADTKKYEYPDFKQSAGHFNKECEVKDYNNAEEVRTCQVAKLADLKEDHPDVRKFQLAQLNRMIETYAIGFLVDKAKFMYPWELGVRQTRLKDVEFIGKRPVMFFDVEDYGNGEAVTYKEYTDMGRVTDYKYGAEVFKWFTSKANFIDIIKRDNLFPDWIPSDDALVFLTNVYTYTNEKRADVLRYNENPELFKLATIFMLAYNHGLPLVMSTYKLSKPFNDAGPPIDDAGNLKSPGIECKGGWNCEHRLPEISRMAFFNRDCLGQPVKYQTGGTAPGQFAFSRGKRGFIAFNLEDNKWSQTFQTGLPEGEYCELMTGGVVVLKSRCHKDAVKVKVDSKGSLFMDIPPKSARAIHVWSKVGYRIQPDDVPRITYVEKTGLFKSLIHWLSFSGRADIIPQAAPWAGEPGSSGQSSGGDLSKMPLPGQRVRIRTGTTH